ncbi:MAG: caspase family protein [Bacteroidota bacterium]
MTFYNSITEPIEKQTISTVKQKRKLFALVIGINDYQDHVFLTSQKIKFPKLRGCTADAVKIKNYLEQDQNFESDIVTLLNEQATKAEIVKNFTSHFGKAEKNDVAIFYYSGHGTQEFVDKKVFSSETDEKSESLVCYYDADLIDQVLLSDKEVRWMIRNSLPEGCHFVTIFDCCHSEGICRSSIQEAYLDVCEKRIPFVFPERPWSQYIFSKEIIAEDLAAVGEHVLLPEFPTIQIAACESFEPALEIGGEGIFTKCLLKVLRQNNGNITYAKLMDQVRMYMKSLYEQKPRIYSTAGNDFLSAVLFLDKKCNFDSNNPPQILFNDDLGWVLNRGLLHGITTTMETVGAYLDDEILASAKITSVEIDHALVLFDDEPDRNHTYQAYIPQLGVIRLNVFLHLDKSALAEKKQLYDLLLESLANKVFICGTEDKADYVIRHLDEHYFITLPFESLSPVTELVTIQNVRLLIRQLDHISNWEFVRRLAELSPKPLPANKIEIAFSVNEAEYEVYRVGDLVIDFHQKDNKWQNSIRIKLTNTTNKTLYVCALLLTSDFASFNGFLNPPVYVITSGNSVLLNIRGNTAIPLSLEDKCKWYNQAATHERFNFIVSEEIFDADYFNIDALPPPPTPMSTRSAFPALMDAETEEASYKCFYVQEFTMLFNNPLYNTISEERLKQMLNDDVVRRMALGLYFNCADNGIDPLIYSLKPQVIVNTKTESNNSISVRQRLEDMVNETLKLKPNKYEH